MKKNLKHGINALLYSSVCVVSLLSTSTSQADVKFRLAYDSIANEYVVYMTPETLPDPDMALSSQVTLVVPHGSDPDRFDAERLQSHVNGIAWINHSRVDAPPENPTSDYLSFGFFYTGSTPPPFGWIAGEEKRIFSFQNPAGCVDDVALLENKDPFNNLPNSANTNPGNDFTNIGWLHGYTGNYGGSIDCDPKTRPPHHGNAKDRSKRDSRIKGSYTRDRSTHDDGTTQMRRKEPMNNTGPLKYREAQFIKYQLFTRI